MGGGYEEGGTGDWRAGGEDAEEREDLGAVEMEETETGVEGCVGLYSFIFIFISVTDTCIPYGGSKVM